MATTGLDLLLHPLQVLCARAGNEGVRDDVDRNAGCRPEFLDTPQVTKEPPYGRDR